MSDTMWSKGPWHVKDGDDVYADNLLVAGTFNREHYMLQSEQIAQGVTLTSLRKGRANAHLIASAPGMYDCILGLQGLLQLVASRSDVPADLLEAVRANHRWIEAEETLKQARGGE